MLRWLAAALHSSQREQPHDAMTRSTGTKACILILLSIAAGPAHAHGGGTTGTATVVIDGPQVRYSLSLSDIPAGPLADQMGFGQPGIAPDYQALPAAIARQIRIAGDGAACSAGTQSLRLPSAAAISIEVGVTFICPGEVHRLFIRDDLADALGPGHHTFTLLLWPGGSAQYTFDASARELLWSARHGVKPVIGAGGAFGYGLVQVFQGYVHLLFLLALMLGAAGFRAWLAIVSAFALAHGVAMAVPAFEIAVLSPRLADAAMLLTGAGVAAWKLVRGYAGAPGWAVALAIGALHGLGAAPAAQAFAFSMDGLLPGIAAHAAGLWVGQGIVVAMALPTLRLCRNQSWTPKASAALAAGLLAAGVYLLLRETLAGP